MTAITIASDDEGFDWRTQGVCTASVADLHYADVDDLIEEHGFTPAAAAAFVVEAEELAKATCLGCPVRSRCLDAAMMNVQGGEKHGVWGGLTPAERAARRPAYLENQRKLGRFVRMAIPDSAVPLHTNPGVDQRYRERLEMARAVLKRLRSLPEDWTLDTRTWLPQDGHYGEHTRDTLIELFDLIRMHPTASAKTLADGLGRSTSWFNSLTRSCRRELGIGV